MLVGYMRVSTTDDRQTVDLQRDALVATGVDHRHLHTDKASGARDDRPGLKACLEYLKAGDMLVVWKLDRLARSVRQLVETAEDLAKREIGLRVLTQAIDTTSPGGMRAPGATMQLTSRAEAGTQAPGIMMLPRPRDHSA